MKTLLLFVLVGILGSSSFEMKFGGRLQGDKKLYSWRLAAGPYPEAQDIKLIFDYRTEDVLFKREYLTMIELFRTGDDVLPHYFEQIIINSTHLLAIPVRRSVTEYWLEGNLYGIDEPPYPDDWN